MLRPSNRRPSDLTKQNDTFVERLLIFYPELPTICEGTIDESSSLEELTEHILYFHDGKSSNWDGADACQYATEDAVKFAGLCAAMYTFPSAFSEENDDRSREIHFGNSTLVFCPLEKNEEILCVVQVSKGNPLAIRSSIQRSHDIFCLLRGGGILPRLKSKEHLPDNNLKKSSGFVSFFDQSQSQRSSFSDDSMPAEISVVLSFERDSLSRVFTLSDECLEDDGCVYAGMKSLYRLRKMVRKKKLAVSKLSGILELKRKAIEEELEETIQKLDSLCLVLPISSLRRELKAHYDEYLAQTSLSNRCLLAMVPRPVGIDVSINTAGPSAAAKTQLRHAIRSLLKHTSQSSELDDPQLVAISSFYRGNLLYTQSLQDLKEDSANIAISNQSASQIMRYMTYFEQRMQLQPSKRLPLLLMMRVTSLKRLQQNVQDSLQQLNLPSHKKTTTEQELVAFGKYLSSPPLSMLNIADELSEVSDAVLGNVWTPTFYVLVGTQHVPAQVAFYTLNDYTFLVYLDAGELDMSPDTLQLSSNSFYGNYFSDKALPSTPTSDTGKEDEAEEQLPVAQLLANVSLHLSVCVNDAEAAAETPRSLSQEKGVDIIFVNRLQEDVVFLLSKNDRLGRLGKVIRQRNMDRDDNDDGLLAADLRRQLLTRLTIDAMDALDDMMNEIHNKANTAIELCTYLPHGWVWAASSGVRELYLLFDLIEHSTIKDVQQTAERIRKHFFDERNNFE